MTKTDSMPETEEELEISVSNSIRQAEILEDAGSPLAGDAWRDVMEFERRIAAMTRAADITGGVARVGAVRAALAAGMHDEAQRLATQYLSEDSLPSERRNAIARAFGEETRKHLAHRPDLDKIVATPVSKENARGGLRYKVKWVVDGEERTMLTRETLAEALDIARALLATRLEDIWLEAPDGRRAASFEDIVGEEHGLLGHGRRSV